MKSSIHEQFGITLALGVLGIPRIAICRKAERLGALARPGRPPEVKITSMKDGRTDLAYKMEQAVDFDTGAALAVTVADANAGARPDQTHRGVNRLPPRAAMGQIASPPRLSQHEAPPAKAQSVKTWCANCFLCSGNPAVH